MKKNTILLTVMSLMLMMLILPIAACAEKEPTSQEDMQVLLKESADKMESTKNISTANTGSFSVEIPQMAEEMGLEVGKITGDLNMTTAQNTAEQETEMKLNASVDMGGSVTMKVGVEYWYIDGWHYFHFDIPFAGEKWGKTNQHMEGMEKFTDSTEDIADLLLNNIQMEYLGKEDINGKAGFHINIKPTEETVKKIVEWIAKNIDGTNEDVTEVFENQTFKTVMGKLIDGLKLEVWIDKSTKLISQLKFALDVEFSPAELEMEDVPSDSGNIKLFFDITLNMKAQTEMISIAPPAEALNADVIDPENFGSMFE